MTINACANSTGMTFPQQPNMNSRCNSPSAESIIKKLLESLQQKSATSCSGGTPSCSGGGGGGGASSVDPKDEKAKALLQALMAQMGAQQQRPVCGAPQQASQCRAQSCAV